MSLTIDQPKIPATPADPVAEDESWDLVIQPRHRLLAIPFAEIWRYRDLLLLLVRRDFVAMYKQTILGPLWFIIQPIMTTLVFTLVFGNIAGISTDGLPKLLFYLSGITCWNYFAETLTKTSETFTANANIFGKVYFPRVIIPLSIVVSSLLKLGVQFLLFVSFAAWFYLRGSEFSPTWAMSLLPILVLIMAMMGLGLGMIISSMTTKYRDLRFLLTFAIQLLMYATPVIYPASALPQKYAWIIRANPMTPIIETFRYGFLGAGQFTLLSLGYSAAVTLGLLVVGTISFNQVEKTLMDTV